jgi:hypothetical protein
MDLEKEAFKINDDNFNEGLKIVFTKDSAEKMIQTLSYAIRPKDQDGLGKEDFYVWLGGNAIKYP